MGLPLSPIRISRALYTAYRLWGPGLSLPGHFHRLGTAPPPTPGSPGSRTDLRALTQHMVLLLSVDGLGEGVLRPREAMWLRGHRAELQPVSPRQGRPDAPALSWALPWWLRPQLPPADSRPLHLGPVTARLPPHRDFLLPGPWAAPASEHFLLSTLPGPKAQKAQDCTHQRC